MTAPNPPRLRLAILPDFPEEHWPSMDLLAEQLLSALTEFHADRFTVQRVCPAFRSTMTGLLGRRSAPQNMDRLLNRFITYPRYAKKLLGDFDLFHVCDHSYSQLLHVLPADRTGVYCHDLDTFQCLLNPAAEPRPRWFRAMARRVLKGFQKARIVFHSTDEIRRQILQFGLIDPARLVQAPPGISAEYSPIGTGLALPATVPANAPFLLHVGSCIPRKRIDVLLDVFASVRNAHPGLRLLKIGGDWTTEQRAQIDRLAIGPAVITLGWQSREVIAECYRRSAAVLITSDAEGFGLPLIEALACGAAVLASSIPVLREVGAEAASYAPVADVTSWSQAINRILADPLSVPAREARLAGAAKFSWRQHAATIAAAYESLAVGNLDAAGGRS